MLYIFYFAHKCVTLHVLLKKAIFMSPKKTTTLNLRVDPAIKEAIKIAASLDHRSVANMIEMLIRKHCDQEGISIPEQRALFGDADA